MTYFSFELRPDHQRLRKDVEGTCDATTKAWSSRERKDNLRTRNAHIATLNLRLATDEYERGLNERVRAPFTTLWTSMEEQ